MPAPLADSNSLPADGDVARYHAVTPWAVAALVLGLLSPLAFVGPLLWLLPLFCLVVALVAFWKIASSAGELVGWNIALLGLLLALLFGLAAPVRTLTRQYWIESRAELFARRFIDLLQQGRTYAAYQLTLSPSLRKPLDVDLSEEYAKDPRAQQRYENFLRLEPVKTLSAQRDQASVEQLEMAGIASDEDYDQVAVRYRISHQQSGATVPLVVQLTVMRSVDGRTGREQWTIRPSNVVE